MKKIYYVIILTLCLNAVSAQVYVTIPDNMFRIWINGHFPGAMNGNQLNTVDPQIINCKKITFNWNSAISNLEGLQYFTNLDTLICPLMNVDTINALPPHLKYFDCKNSNIHTFPLFPSSLKYFDCSLIYPFGNLPQLPDSLETLICIYGGLTSVSNLPNSLKVLDISRNNITSISNIPTSLEYLSCFWNDIVSLPPLPNSLKFIYCHGNNLTSINTIPDSLHVLQCNHNQIVSLGNLPSTLTQLYCDTNSIACLPILPNSITSIRFFSNPLTCLPNYISSMSTAQLSYPLCSPNNTGGCPTVITTGITETQEIPFSFYPNPSNGLLNIEFLSDQHIYITDVTGNIVFNQTLQSGKNNIYLSNLPGGVYNIHFNEKGIISNKKLVIVK